MSDVETPEYIAMLRRMLRAAGRRVGDADPEDLTMFISLRDDLERAIAAAVHSQRAVHGRSWADIGRGLGTTREAAFMRYRDRSEDEVTTLSPEAAAEVRRIGQAAEARRKRQWAEARRRGNG